MPIQMYAAALTDPGRQRALNEDTVFQKIIATPDEDALGLFVVADGIGGRLAGEAASYWAVESIKKSFSDLIDYYDPRATHQFTRQELSELLTNASQNLDDLQKRMTTAVEKANEVVRDYARHNPVEAQGAGSTLTIALVDGLQVFVANVGDSRAYLLREGVLHQITRDHSIVQRLIEVGTLQPSERYTHPKRNLIYRSLGVYETVEVDTFSHTAVPGDRLLLCTDGLWEMVQTEGEMVRIIESSPSEESACQRLIDAANAAGGADNIGVVLVRLFE